MLSHHNSMFTKPSGSVSRTDPPLPLLSLHRNDREIMRAVGTGRALLLLAFSLRTSLIEAANDLKRPADVCEAPPEPKKWKGHLSQDWLRAVKWTNDFSSKPQPQSEYQFSDLAKWGWQCDEDPPALDMTGLQVAFKDLGINTVGVENVRQDWDHAGWDDQWQREGFARNIDGGSYKATGAEYSQMLNVIDGVIVVDYMKSPKAATREWEDKNPYYWRDGWPKLGSWADVTSLIWEKQLDDHSTPKQGLRPLEWVFFVDIGSPDIFGIIMEAFQQLSTHDPECQIWIPAWPGRSFSLADDEGKALLGTDIGQQVARILTQHKGTFPGMSVDFVHVFSTQADVRLGPPAPSSDHQVWPSLAFHIAKGERPRRGR